MYASVHLCMCRSVHILIYLPVRFSLRRIVCPCPLSCLCFSSSLFLLLLPAEVISVKSPCGFDAKSVSRAHAESTLWYSDSSKRLFHNTLDRTVPAIKAGSCGAYPTAPRAWTPPAETSVSRAFLPISTVSGSDGASEPSALMRAIAGECRAPETTCISPSSPESTDVLPPSVT